MATIKRVLRCNKCGIPLQSDNPDEPGYCPSRVLERESLSQHVLYCQTCFEESKILNSGELNNNVDAQTLKILDDAVATDAIVVWVVDLFAFNGILKNEIVKKIKDLKLVVLGTKFDLFPKNTNKDRLKEYLKERFNEAGLYPIKISILDNDEHFNAVDVIRKMHELRRAHDVYMIGTSLSGKTSIINRAMKFFNNKSRWTIKSEFYPGTSQKVLEIPLSNSSFFYELPGLSLDNSVVSKVEKEVSKIIIPKKTLKVSTITLKPGESILIGGLSIFSLIEGLPTTFKLFTAENVENKKVLTSKADSIFKENYHKRLIRPVSDLLCDFKDFDVFQYEMDNDDKWHDIAVEGLGWFSFVAKGQTIRISIPKKAALKESLSRIY